MAGQAEQKRLEFEGFEPFDAHTQSYWVKQGEVFRRLLCEGVQQSGDKQGSGVAQDVNANATQFSEALNGKGGRHFSALWIPRAIYADPQNRALNYLAAVRKMRCVPVAPLTSKQIAMRALEAMVTDGAAGEALLKKAFGADAEAVVRATLGEEAP